MVNLLIGSLDISNGFWKLECREDRGYYILLIFMMYLFLNNIIFEIKIYVNL